MILLIGRDFDRVADVGHVYRMSDDGPMRPQRNAMDDFEPLRVMQKPAGHATDGQPCDDGGASQQLRTRPAQHA